MSVNIFMFIRYFCLSECETHAGMYLVTRGGLLLVLIM